MRYLLLLLLLMPTAAALNVTVTLDTPDTAIPGATVPVTVATFIDGVPVISVPIALYLTRPDGSTSAYYPAPLGDGTYQEYLYVALEGAYEVQAVVSVADAEYAASRTINVQRAAYTGTIIANETHITVTHTHEHRYAITIIDPTPGTLDNQAVRATCAATCVSCSIPCPIGDNLAHIRVLSQFTNELLRSAKEREPVLVHAGTILNTTGALRHSGDALIALPAQTRMDQDAFLVWPGTPTETQHVRVIGGVATPVEASIAYDVGTGAWYALVSQPVTGLVTPTVRDASIVRANRLDGTPLPSTATTVMADGPFEAVLASAEHPPALPLLHTSPYGVRVTHNWSVSLRMSTDRPVVYRLGTPIGSSAQMPTFVQTDNQVYYARADHVLLDAPPGEVLVGMQGHTVSPVKNRETYTFASEGWDVFLVLAEDLRVVTRRERSTLPDNTWTPQLPPGRYFLLLLGTDSRVAPVEVLEHDQVITASPSIEVPGVPNTQVVLSRTITNLDASPRAIDILIDAPYEALLYSPSGTRLTDTNLNGIPDTGIIASGASFTVEAHVLLPTDARTADISWTLSTAHGVHTVMDMILVDTSDVAFRERDVAVTGLWSDGSTYTVSFYNYDAVPHTGEAVHRTTTPAGEDAAQYTVSLPPGETTRSYPLPDGSRTVRVELLTPDDRPENNYRTLRLARGPGEPVRVSEQYHQDHDGFRVKVAVPPGVWSVTYPDDKGALVVARVARLDAETLLFELPLPANTDLVASLLPGEPEAFAPFMVIDNRDDRVQRVGTWFEASQVPGFFGVDYLTDLGQGKGDRRVEYRPGVPGHYEVSMWHPGDPLFASNTRVSVGAQSVLVDQRSGSAWKYLGRYWFDASTPIVVSTLATDGHVVSDAFQFLRVDQYAYSAEPTPIVAEEPPAVVGHMLYTSRGEAVVAEVSLFRDGRLVKGGLLPTQARANAGRHGIRFVFPDGPVQSLFVHDADPAEMRIGIERVPLEVAMAQADRPVRDAFAIDPRFSSEYTFTKVAAGTALLKCTEYDFSTRTCTGPFTHVQYLVPGQEYSATLSPEDPLLIEVDDEVIPPVRATCIASTTWSSSNCLGTYDDTPACSNERIWCNDGTREQWTGDRDATFGIDARYSDVDRDPDLQCDTIQDVFVLYRVWETGSMGLQHTLSVSNNNGSSWTQVHAATATPDTTGTLQSYNVTGDASWDCQSFFGDNTTARARITATRGGGGPPMSSYTFHVDYLVFRVDYNYTIDALETEFTSYQQGDTVHITGQDFWDNSTNVTINVSNPSGTVVYTFNTTTNGSGVINTTYVLGDFAPTGTWTLYGWQPNNVSKNASKTFTVTKRSPTINTQVTGDYFNRSQTVIFSGEKWAKGANVTVAIVDPDGYNYTISPSRNLTNSSGGLLFYWDIPASLDFLTGTYAVFFQEEVNSTYNRSKEVYVVVLPSRSFRQDGTDTLSTVDAFDGSYASFTDSAAGYQFVNFSFPVTMPMNGVVLSSLVFELYRYESSTASPRIQWLNPGTGTWQDACSPAASTTALFYQCNITTQVNQSNYMNQVNVRYSDAGGNGWPQNPTYNVDIGFLRVRFNFPPPAVNLMSPANDSWWRTDTHNLTYNATNTLAGIDECRLYINGNLEYTNTSFIVNATDVYAHTFTEGNHTWYVSCTDNTSRRTVGTSETWNILVDLTDPISRITYPATNYTWTNLPGPEINFTANDTLDPRLNWTVYVNGTADQSGVMTNGSVQQVFLSAQADGLKTVVVEVWDRTYRYATNKTVFLYVDSTPPQTTLHNPVHQYNTSGTSLVFNWSVTDNLDVYPTCDVYLDGVANVSGIGTVNGSSNTTTISSIDDGYHTWYVVCADRAGNTNQSLTRNFTVDTTPPTVTLISPAPFTLFDTTRDVTLEYNVTDVHLPVGSCSLWLDGAKNQTNTSVSKGVSQYFWLTNLSRGVYNWSVECADLVGNAANSSWRLFTVNVTVFPVSPVNASVVDRDGVSIDPDVLLLVANVSDAQPGVPVSFYANRTAPSVQNRVFLGMNVTNASGSALFWFDPNASHLAGNWTWWPEADDYANKSSRYISLFGSVNVSFQHPTRDPNAEYNQSQTALLNATVSSPVENALVLNTTYGLFVNATIVDPAGPQTYRTLTGIENLSASYTISGSATIGIWEVQLNTSSPWHYENSTVLWTRNFTVKGAANTMNPPNGTVVDRDGVSADPDVLPLVIQIPGAAAGYAISFLANMTAPAFSGETRIALGNNTTNASGHATLYFNPNSSFFAGDYVWWVESVISFINQSSTFRVKGSSAVNPRSPLEHPNSSYWQLDPISFRMNVTSGPPKETQQQLGNNYSLSVNVTWYPPSGSPRSFSTLSFDGENWTTTSTIGFTAAVAANWEWEVNASGPYTYLSQDSGLFDVFGLGNLSVADDTDVVVRRVYELVNFTANYTNTTGDPINSIDTVCLVRFNTSGWTAYEPMVYHAASGTYWYNRSFSETYDAALFNVWCNDSWYTAQNETGTFTINKTFVYQSGPRGANVDRDGVGPDPEELFLNASIPLAPPGVVVHWYHNLSTPDFGQTNIYIGNNTTNAAGHAMTWWNPNATIFAGNHTVWSDAAVAVAGNTTYAHVFAGILASFRNASYHPDTNYTQNATAFFHANASTIGPESPGQLNGSYALVYTAYLQSVYGQDSASLSFVGPYWSGTYSLLALGGVGLWNVSVNASGSFLYPAADNRSFLVYGFMNVTDASLAAGTVYAYGYAQQRCRVQDMHTDVNVSGAIVSFYRNGTFLGTNTTNSTGQAVLSFQTNSTGTYNVSCSVADQPGIYYFVGDGPMANATLTVIPFPITPVSPVNGTLVDRDGASASISDVVLLNVSVPALIPDGVTIQFFSTLDHPLVDGPFLLGSNVTASGNAVFWYDPPTASFAGNHSWYGTNPNATTNGTRIFMSIGSFFVMLWNTSGYPDVNYTQNATAVFRLNLTSPGPETRTALADNYSATLNFTLQSPLGSAVNQTLYVNPFWQGQYALLALGGVGQWNLSANASANYFLPAGMAAVSFTVFGFMNVTESTVSIPLHYVYGSTTQYCTVRDQHTAVLVAGANVSFFRNNTYLGWNVTNTSGIAGLSFQTNVSGVYTIACNVSDQAGSIYYLAGDDPSSTNTLTVLPFPITPVSPVNGTMVDRDGVSGVVDDVILLNVSVPSYVPDGILILFYSNVTHPFSSGPHLLGNNTTVSGHALLWYDPPTASTAGNHSWYGESASGAMNGSRFFSSFGGLVVSRWNASHYPDANHTQNETVAFRFNLTGSGPETREQLNASYLASLNFTLASSNGSNTTNTIFVNPFWQGQFPLLSLRGVGSWTLDADAIAEYFFPAAMPQSLFDVFGFMNVTDIQLGSATSTVFQNVTASCRVQDQHTHVSVSGAQVEFFVGGISRGSAATNSTGWATRALQMNTTGNHEILCSIADQPGLFYYAGDAPNASENVTVIEYLLATVGPPNGTRIDRDGAGPDAEIVLLEAQALSWVPAGRPVQFLMNLTLPSLGYADVLVGVNTTDSSGRAVFWFDPNSTMYAGNWSWWANESLGASYNSSYVFIIGGLNVSFADPVYDPDATYNKSDTIRVNATLVSRGPESSDELNASYAAEVNTTLTLPSSMMYAFAMDYDGLQWTGSRSVNVDDTPGEWNVSLSSLAEFFYPRVFGPRVTTIFSWMNVTGSNLTPSTVYVYGSSTATCQVLDHFNHSPVAGAVIGFYRNGTLLGTNTTNFSGSAALTFQTSTVGNFSIVCNVSDQPARYHLAGPEPNATMLLTVLPFPVTPVSPANGTLVDRDSGSLVIPDVVLLNVSVPSYVPDGVNLTFSSNITDPFAGGPFTLGNNDTTSGNAWLWYDPPSSVYAGNRSWWAQNGNSTPNGTRTIIIIGSLQVSLWDESTYPFANYSQNETIELRFNLTSLGPETRDQLNASYDGAVNFTLANSFGSVVNGSLYVSPYWSGSFSLLSLGGVGVWNLSVNSSARYFLSDDILDLNFTVYGFMNVTDSALSRDVVYAYEFTSQSCRVQDQHTYVNVSNANVSFWRDAEYLGWNGTDANGSAVFWFQTNLSGSYEVYCNVSDQASTLYYLAGDEPQRNNSLTVLPYPITPVSPANDTVVDRDGMSPLIADVILLNVSVPSRVPDGVTITFLSNLTDPLTGGPYVLGSNVTTGGHAWLWYNPPNSSFAGNHSWFGNETNGKFNGTRSFLSFGGLDLSLWSLSSFPFLNYSQNDSVEFRLNLSSLGVESRSQLNGSFGSSVNVSLLSSNGSVVVVSSFVGPYWSSVFSLLSLGGVGLWDLRANASAAYFFFDDLMGVNFTVYGHMNVTNNSLSRDSIFVYDRTSVVCEVADQHTHVPVSNAVVTFWRNDTYLGMNVSECFR
jgi:hypothetical protein